MLYCGLRMTTSWLFTPIVGIFLVATFISVLVAIMAWRRRATPGGTPLALLMVIMTEVAIMSALEAAAVEIPVKITLSKLQYLGIINAPPLSLVFVIEYIHLRKWLKPRFLALFWIIPVITALLAFSNEWHGWVWSSFSPSPAPGSNLIIYGHGFWFWIWVIYAYAIITISIIFLTRAYISTEPLYRRQAGALLIGLTLPWVANGIYIFSLSPIPGLDLTPITFIISGLAVTLGVFRFQLFNLVPVARDILIESMSDAVVVLDAQDRIVDINPALQQLTKIDTDLLIGKPAESIFAAFPEIDKQYLHAKEARAQISLKGDGSYTLDMRISPLRDQHGFLTGRLIVLRDITERIRAEQAEREQRSLAEALRDTAVALNSTLNFDEVLDRILSNLDRVVPHDSANIALVDEEGITRIVRARGYSTRDLDEYILSIEMPVNKLYHWKQMVELNKPVIVPDIRLDNTWIQFPKTTWIRSYAGAPIIVKRIVVGFLNLESTTPGFFTLQQADPLQAFADQAAVAMQNARLFDETSRRVEEMTTLNKIGLALTSGLDLEQVLRELQKQCQKIIPLDCFYIALYDDTSGNIQIPLFYEAGEYKIEGQRNIDEQPGLSGYVIRTKKTYYLPDTINPVSPLPIPLIRTGGTPTRSYIGVPLLLGERVIGVISIQSYQPNAYSQNEIRLLETIATQATIAIDNARLFQRMEQLATVDSLTGIYNRRQFSFLAENEVERALRYNRQLTLIMMDLDRFKDVNDTFGHKTGDQVLQTICKRCAQALRKIDIMGRYGGEEFVVILPETSTESAFVLADRLRKTIEDLEILAPKGSIHVTASLGLAALDEQCITLENLLECADKALYDAKQAGRNQVKVYKH